MPVPRIVARRHQPLATSLLLLVASLVTPSGAQVEPLFADGFASGDLCAWSATKGAITITFSTPREGSFGTEIYLEGSGFSGPGAAPEVFLSSRSWSATRVFLDVLDFDDDWILAQFNGGAAVGDYLLNVSRCYPSMVARAAAGFGVRLPTNLVFAPEFVAAGEQVSMSGLFFGEQRGQVSIRSLEDGSAGEQPVTIAWWVDSVPDPLLPDAFLSGEVVFTMPGTLPANGLYDVTVTNDLGAVTARGGLVGVDVADGDSEPLRVVGAVATSNTEVLVQFSEAVQGGIESAENPAHYRIDGRARTPTVGVVAAEVLWPHLTTVRLTTLSQSDLLYTLTVANVVDLAGNPIAPPELLIPNPNSTTFVGLPPGGGGPLDSDGDGLSDADEQLGWVVTVVRADGSSEVRHVTSDPMLADTDGDGVTDPEEKHAGLDPRTADTDGDTLTDDDERNVILSDGTRRDTDGDGAEDGFEHFVFRTSPILADTDGDQVPDPAEVTAANRNPLVAELPAPRIRVGHVNLQLDTRLTFTDDQGQVVSEDRSTDSTLTRGTDETYATSDENSTKSTLQFSQSVSAKAEVGEDFSFAGGSVKVSAGFKQGSERGSTFTVDRESGRSSEEAYHSSLTTSTARDLSQSTTREILDAAVKVDVSIENLGDVPFTIGNLELTAQTQDPLDRRELIPVASLVPEDPNLGDINIGSLGDPSRGPFSFTTVSVFPQQVEELMKNPRGVVVQLANFDITDEAGRNFAFISQEVLDRTAGITFDLGDGRVESYRVATASAHERTTGMPLGITMEHALTGILGLYNAPTVRDGGNGVVDSVAVGDDVQEAPFGSAVEPGEVVVTVGANGVLDTALPGGDDEVVAADYETRLLVEADTIRDGGDQFADTVADAADEQVAAVGSRVFAGELIVGPGPDGILTTTPSGDDVLVSAPSPHLVLSRFRDVEEDSTSRRFWVLYSDRDLPDTDLDSIVIRSGESYNFTYVQDKDGDGVWAREEFLHNSSDLLPNTDSCTDAAAGPRPADNCDNLSDREEIQEGWFVQLKGAPSGTNVYPNPDQGDSDRDSLLDHEEKRCLLDPRQRDTDLDGLTDWEELRGMLLFDGGPGGVMVSRDPDTDQIVLTVTPYSGNPGGGLIPHDVIVGCSPSGFATDPLDPDTDGDGVGDLAELGLGLNPNDPDDGATYLDDDGDGVPNATEREGFFATVNGVAVGPFTSNPGNPDSDGDGLPDLLEHFLKSNPLEIDTDGDGITDPNEYKNGGDACVTVTPGILCTRFADLLDGNFQQFVAACAEADVCDNATIESFLTGIGAKQYGTNLNESDTDFDSLTDLAELTVPRTITVNGSGVNLSAPVSDPLLANSDADGWDDAEEETQGTDPRNDDTDGDGLQDDLEAGRTRDPNFRDKRVSVSSTGFNITVSDDEGPNNDADPRWSAKIAINGGGFGPEVCSYSAEGVPVGFAAHPCDYFTQVIRDEAGQQVQVLMEAYEHDPTTANENCNSVTLTFTYADPSSKTASHTCETDLSFTTDLVSTVD